MLYHCSHIILASANTGAFGVMIGVFFVIALAAKIGAAITRMFFALIRIGIGLVVLLIILGVISVFTAIGH